MLPDQDNRGGHGEAAGWRQTKPIRRLSGPQYPNFPQR